MPVKELKAQTYDPPVQPTTPRQDNGFDPNRLGGTFGTIASQIADAGAKAVTAGAKAAQTGAAAATNRYAPSPPGTDYTAATDMTAQVAPASASITGNGSYTAPDYTQQVNDIYDKALAAQRAQLDSGYEASMRELEAAAAKIPGLYQQRGNDLDAQYERQRAAMNERLAANGLNSGTGSQAALAQNAGYLNAYGQISAAQADAQAAIEQQRVAREAEYQAAITQALRDNDYQRAVALTQEMKDQRNADLDRAKILAGYGDFSGYAQLYGDDAAKNMRDVWLAQNPQYAYMTGNLTADQYYKLTGQYPAGYSSPRGYVPQTTTTGDEETPTREIPTYGDDDTTTSAATGIEARLFGRIMSGIGTSRNPAQAAKAFEDTIAPNWASMNDTQRSNVRNVMRTFGYNIDD